MDCYLRKHSVNACWLQTSAFHTCRHTKAYFTIVNVLVLPGHCFLPCLPHRLLTITSSFFGAKYGRLKRILPVCVLLSIIRMRFSGLALAWLHKAASTLNVYQGRIGSSVTELEFYVSRMRNLIICYFVFKNQSHYSGVHGQRVNKNYLITHQPLYYARALVALCSCT